jgi:hypothetical protein
MTLTKEITHTHIKVYVVADYEHVNKFCIKRLVV